TTLESSFDVLNAEWFEHLELMDVSAPPPSSGYRALLKRPPYHSGAISRSKYAQPEPRRISFFLSTKRKQTLSKLPGRLRPRIIASDMLEIPLLLPPGRTAAHAPPSPVSLAEKKAFPEPLATSVVDLTTFS
ncbi:hypothetical protein TSAR_004164, partial [Trichomalopsis sarcophagae]